MLASVQPFWWNVTEQEITLKVWESSPPDVDTWARLGTQASHGAADGAHVLKNEKRMIADLVERVEGGHLAVQNVQPSCTSWNKKNPTQEVPYFVPRLSSFLCGICVRCRKRQVQQGQMFVPVSLGATRGGRPARSRRIACAAR